MTRNSRAILAVIGGAAAVFWPGALTYTYPGIMTPYWERAFGASKGTIGTALFVALPMAGTFMFVAGKLQEKFGTRWMTRIGALVCTAALFVSAPLAADCFGLKHFGAIFGLIFIAYGFIAGMIGSSLAGYALDLTGSFRVVFGYMAVSSVLSGIMVRMVAMPERTKTNVPAKVAAAADPA